MNGRVIDADHDNNFVIDNDNTNIIVPPQPCRALKARKVKPTPALFPPSRNKRTCNMSDRECQKHVCSLEKVRKN